MSAQKGKSGIVPQYTYIINCMDKVEFEVTELLIPDAIKTHTCKKTVRKNK